MDRILQLHLGPIARRRRAQGLWRALTPCWLAGSLAGAGLLLVSLLTGWRFAWAPAALAAGTGAAVWVRWWRWRRQATDYVAAARQIEQDDASLKGLLLTAAEQEPDPVTGAFHYLQRRVIDEAMLSPGQSVWRQRAVERSVLAGCVQAAAFGLFLAAFLGLATIRPAARTTIAAWLAGVSVTPGDTSLERGRSLVVLARFGRGAPGAATLVVKPTDGPERRVPLTKNLNDPIFGASLPEVNADLTYRVEYENQRTRDFQVTVFDLPRLERADAHLVFPDYTGLPERTIGDTRRVSAVEGTRLDYTFLLNKPVASATLVGRDQSSLPLQIDTARSNVAHLALTLEQNRRFELRLTDHAGRTNTTPPEFVLEALTNRPPELKLVSPRGDQQVSPLEELSFQAEAVDDFGLRAYGLAYTVADGETRLIELGRAAPGHERRALRHLLALEDLALQPGQVLTWFLWAEDLGPDGQPRRTTSDLFFAEVRPLDEVFREGQAPSSAGQGQQGQQGQEGSPAVKLAELQKEIVNATWNLQRRESGRKTSGRFQPDLAVIHESQQQALEQAGSLGEQNESPRSQALVEAVEQQMERAVQRLAGAAKENSPAGLPPALSSEQAAYQALLRLQAHEFQVAQGRSARGSSGRGDRAQRQLDQLELKQSENRYETAREAAPEQRPEQREQLRVLSRLKELARRQQDLNERLRELQTALTEARTEAEREDVRRQLKRLREEEQDVLADVDELRQRLDRPENQSRLADTRRRLEDTRSQVQRAGEAMEDGAVSQALAAGARAESELQQMREEVRKRNSSQLQEDVRQMRDEVRRLQENEAASGRKLNELVDESRRALSDAEDRNALADQFGRQTGSLTNLLDQVRRVSEQSEAAEPLLAKQLQDVFRKTTQDDAANLQEVTQELLQQGALKRAVYDRLREPSRPPAAQSLSATRDLVRDGQLGEARLLEQKAREDLNGLKQGIERAAGSVLGDDLEALRLAGRELDDLGQQLANEVAQGETRRRPPGETGTPEDAASGGESKDARQPSTRGDAGNSGSQPSAAPETASAEPGARSGARRNFFDQGGGGGGGGGRAVGPLTGADYRQWIDRLAEVEELVEIPEWRGELARVRDRVRVMRGEYTRHGREPQWDLVKTQIGVPLTEVRRSIAQEVARRQSPDSLVPVDRDPVPARYSELVRRYYEQLGK